MSSISTSTEIGDVDYAERRVGKGLVEEVAARIVR